MSGNTITAPVKEKAPDKKPVAPVQVITGSGTSGDSTGSKLKLPSAAQLEASGVPKAVAKLVAGESININTYDGENPTGEELLEAIDSINSDTFDPRIAKAINDNDIRELNAGLLTYLKIPPSGTEEQQADAADLAADHIPQTGADAGDLGAIVSEAAPSNQTLETEAETAEEKEALKVDNAEINYYDNANASSIDAANSGATTSAKYTALANADATLTAWGIDTPEMNNMVASMAAEGVTNPNEILDNIRRTATYKSCLRWTGRIQRGQGARPHDRKRVPYL